MGNLWSRRADAAERAALARHARRLWGLPCTELGVVAWPPELRERTFGVWNYWWQAHLIDCAVDAAVRLPTQARVRRLRRLTRSPRIRNLTGWTNRYYDDMAWMGLALERAGRQQQVEHPSAIQTLESRLVDAWNPAAGGGIPWRRRDDFYNAPANGPAAILLARTGRLWRAQEMADWIDERLRDPVTGLIFDGLRGTEVERVVYSYCQGVVLGAETELAVRMGDPRHSIRVRRLVAAVSAHLCSGGVITGGGSGDGGLFNGILARYLALVATELPVLDAEDEDTRRLARSIVLSSAESAWANRLSVDGLPLFGCRWTVPAVMPELHGEDGVLCGDSVHASSVPERDLSVQLSGWMLLESAHTVEVLP
ncbi:glycoside hydrolase family 76 protein [Speluncibacter jeojiensis]|uniref:Fructose-bisphosphate aldolase n=1 Tax=Speluncibacter jeojiensis TaxID=2710754 RepID=A0A9X4M1W5_9ACTN|nr:fructose-bisphosphate aldolase [Corynebacteriales bacterium D3-21]